MLRFANHSLNECRGVQPVEPPTLFPLGDPALDRADDFALALPRSLFIPTERQAICAAIASELYDSHSGIHDTLTLRRSPAALCSSLSLCRMSNLFLICTTLLLTV
jgi:hypothetical protein